MFTEYDVKSRGAHVALRDYAVDGEEEKEPDLDADKSVDEEEEDDDEDDEEKEEQLDDKKDPEETW